MANNAHFSHAAFHLGKRRTVMLRIAIDPLRGSDCCLGCTVAYIACTGESLPRLDGSLS
jgi:hypothetical protein